MPTPTASSCSATTSRASNSPVIDNLRKAGAVILGRTNCPAFSYRWFTTNLLHGDTKNPRDPSHYAGRLVRRRGGCGRGRHRAHRARHRYRGLDPLSGLCLRRPRPAADGRPGRGPNASLPERAIAPQSSAVSGPLARTIGDLRIALAAMSGTDVRDTWWVPAPLEGPPMPKRAAMSVAPDGLETVAEVKAAVSGRGKRLERAGWTVEEVELPPLREAADWQTKLWLGDSYETQLDAAEREGDPGALACLRGNSSKVFPFDAAAFSKALVRRATLDARMAAVPGEISGRADAGVRRIAVSRPSRPQGRRLLCAGVAGAIAADRYSLHATACANRVHGIGGAGSRRRPAGFRPLSRGSVPAGRARRSKPAARRRRRSIPCTDRIKVEPKEQDGWRLRFHGELACRRGSSLEAVRGAGAADRQYRERLRLHAAISRASRRCIRRWGRAAFRCWDFRATSSAARNPATPGKSSNSAPPTMPSPFRCLPRSTSTATTPIRCINI